MSANNTTNLTNTSIEYDITVLGVMYVVATILVMTSNFIVITVVASSQSLHLPKLWNIAFMAVCDFIYGLTYLVFVAPSTFVGRFAYPSWLVSPISCLLTLLTGQNIFNILVATVDRYISMCWPLQYDRLMTSKRFILANSITTAIAVVRLCLIALLSEPFYNPIIAVPMFTFSSGISAAASTGVPFITVLSIVGVLLKLAVEMKRSRARVHPTPTDNTFQHFTLTIALSAVVFCLCYAPLCISILWIMTSGYNAVPVPMQHFTIISLVSNSFWNVIIYGVVYKPFRNEFFRLFCWAYYRKKQQREANIQVERNA